MLYALLPNIQEEIIKLSNLCMKLLNEESKKKGNILLQMEKISGTIAASRDAESGAYVQHIKCTIKEDKFIDDV